MENKFRRLRSGLMCLALASSGAAVAQTQSAAAEKAASGWQAFQRGNAVEARASLTEAVRLRPNQPRYHAALAEVDMSLHDVQGAIRHFEIAVKLNPTNVAVRSRLAQLYQSLDRDLDVIRVLHPPDPPAPLQSVWRFSRGYSLFRLSRMDAARHEFELLADSPDFEASANYFLGRIAYTQNQFKEALPFFAKAVRVGNSPDNREFGFYTYDYGLTLFKLQRYEEANKQFTLSIERNAQEPRAWMMRGRCNEELKKYQDAIADYEQSLKVDPKFELSYYHLARLQQRYGDKQRAAELFKHLGALRESDIKAAQIRAEEQAMSKMKPDAPSSRADGVPTP